MSSGESYDNKGLKHTVLKVDIKNNFGKKSNFSSECEFIFVLDKSSSMGCYVHDILTKVIPKVYDKLNFTDDKIIHLLTFDNDVNVYSYNKKDFINSTLNGGGGTRMGEIPIELENSLNKFDSNKIICLLTLSDGMISDQQKTQDNAENLMKKLNRRFTNFNSQAIRFLSSSYAEPDTRALCSLLQLNSNFRNNNTDILLTFNPSDNNGNSMSENKCEELANEISKLFADSKGSGWIFKAIIDKKFKIEPYGENLSLLELPKGKTTLFIDSICGKDISKDFALFTKDKSKKGSLFSKGEVTQNNLYQVYQDTIETLMKKVIINKGIQNLISEENNKRIFNFIKVLEEKTPGAKKSDGKLTKIFENINNDQSANNLNGNELNDYISKKLNECQESIDIMVKEENKIKNKKKKKKKKNEDKNYKPTRESILMMTWEKEEDEKEEKTPKNQVKKKKKKNEDKDYKPTRESILIMKREKEEDEKEKKTPKFLNKKRKIE